MNYISQEINKFDEFLKIILDGINIEKENEAINGDKAELEYLLEVSNFDQSKFQNNAENLVKDKLKENNTDLLNIKTYRNNKMFLYVFYLN